jgi:hypothetical protein
VGTKAESQRIVFGRFGLWSEIKAGRVDGLVLAFCPRIERESFCCQRRDLHFHRGKKDFSSSSRNKNTPEVEDDYVSFIM